MSKADIALFEMYAREQLEGFGYEVGTVRLPGWRKKLAKLLILLRRMF